MTDPIEQFKLLQLLELDVSRSSLEHFTKFTFKDYEVNWHHRAIFDTVDKFLHTDWLNRLMIFTPPRHGKTEIISRRLPAFIFGNNPDAKVISCSYSADLASMINRDVQRIIDLPEYKRLFPKTKLNVDNVRTQSGAYLRNSDLFEIVGYRGQYRSAGVGGGVTGMGCDCFVADTLISCYEGEKAIQDVVVGDLVLSFNHNLNCLEWKTVIATREKEVNETITIETERTKIECTADHRIFIGEAYIRAIDCNIGDSVVAFDAVSKVFNVRRDLSKAEIRGSQGNKKRNERLLLFKGMLRRASRNQEQKKVQSLRCALCVEKQKILRILQGIYKQKNTQKEKLHQLQYGISASITPNKVLWEGMRKQTSLKKDEKKRKSKIHFWRSLSGFVSKAKTFGDRKRSRRLPSVQKSVTAHDIASYRQRQTQQHSSQSYTDVPLLPHHIAQVKSELISSVGKMRQGKFEVYDIQVEGNHNFFAQGILVHNCLIIDDPIKNQEEADSATMRQKVWDWYATTAYTRLEKNGKVCLVMTRWHQDDLAGRLLSVAESDHNADQWVVLNLPAICENPKHPDDPREVGDPLWPNKYDLKRLEAVRSSIGQRAWASLFQQRPAVAGGNIFKTESWRFWRKLPEKFDAVCQSWDLAFKNKATSDFVAGHIWAKCGADFYLVDRICKRLSFTESCEAIKHMTAKWPNVRRKLVEAKANGDAVVDYLRSQIPGLILVEPHGGKTARANAIAPWQESGNLYLPAPELAPWVNQFIDVCQNFPSVDHDDDIDAMSQAILHLGGKSSDRLRDLLKD